MAKNVRFIRTTKEKYLNKTEYDPLALYFCEDTHEMFKGDALISDGIRVVATYNDLPECSCAADGVVYYVRNTRNGYTLSPDRTEWFQTIYAPAMDVAKVPEDEVYNTVATVGAVRDVEESLYGYIDNSLLALGEQLAGNSQMKYIIGEPGPAVATYSQVMAFIPEEEHCTIKVKVVGDYTQGPKTYYIAYPLIYSNDGQYPNTRVDHDTVYYLEYRGKEETVFTLTEIDGKSCLCACGKTISDVDGSKHLIESTIGTLTASPDNTEVLEPELFAIYEAVFDSSATSSNSATDIAYNGKFTNYTYENVRQIAPNWEVYIKKLSDTMLAIVLGTGALQAEPGTRELDIYMNINDPENSQQITVYNDQPKGAFSYRDGKELGDPGETNWWWEGKHFEILIDTTAIANSYNKKYLQIDGISVRDTTDGWKEIAGISDIYVDLNPVTYTKNDFGEI